MKTILFSLSLAIFLACSSASESQIQTSPASKKIAVTGYQYKDNPKLEEYEGPVVAVLKWDLKNDSVDEFKKKYWPLIVENGRQEKGNVSVELYQSLEDTSVFSLYGIWETKEAFFKHLETSASVSALQGAQAHLESQPEVKIFRKLSI